MKQLWYRFQFLVIIALLLGTAVLSYLIVRRVDWHYDATREKIHSLPQETEHVLRELKGKPLEILVFFPKDDPSRDEMTIFLKECQSAHDNFQFNFYDPMRRPKLAEQYGVDQPYTIIVKSGDHEERILAFTEESFTNALFRIAHPRKLNVCFVAGHQEGDLKSTERNGFAMLLRSIQNGEVNVEQIVLANDGIPEDCKVTVMAGPHQEPAPDEFEKLRAAFKRGQGLVFLLDPMDLGSGPKFISFFKTFGVILGENVLVDKTSRMIGGDFLMPAVANWTPHEAVRRMNAPVFMPVTRTVQPWTEIPADMDVTPLALTGEGSWAESDLALLEDGKSSFDPQHDIAGPLPVAVAVEGKKNGGRMIIVGDSDFATNGYYAVSQNLDFITEALKWTARDARFIRVRPRFSPFKPLMLKPYQKQGLMTLILGVYPLALFLPISIYLIIRSKTS